MSERIGGVSSDAADRAEVRRILGENPAFARILRQFAALYDAAEVLEELKPPQHEIAAPYLRAIADNVMRRDASIGEDFLQAMIRSRESVHPGDAPDRVNR
jgi:hypothetical protein